MTRTDIYVTVAILAWLAGAYLISDGLKASAAAEDRRLTATTYCSIQYIAMYGGEQECREIAEAHRKRSR